MPQTQRTPVHAYLLIDHGSRRAEANALLEEVVRRVRSRMGDDAVVEGAHMEIAAPDIARGFARCVEQGATTVVVHPFMLAPGRHVQEDLPRMIAEAASSHVGVDFVLAAPLGAHEGVIDAALDRVREAIEAKS
jgi:sirohydrochlorin ferrochelatase